MVQSCQWWKLLLLMRSQPKLPKLLRVRSSCYSLLGHWYHLSKFPSFGTLYLWQKSPSDWQVPPFFLPYLTCISRVISSVDSGGVCVNDTLLHACGGLPFGGIGPSGIGAYHGKNTFDLFTRRRAVMRRDDHGILDAPVRSPHLICHFLSRQSHHRYPPYSENNLKLMKTILTLPELPAILPATFRNFTLAALGLLAVVVAGYFNRR